MTASSPSRIFDQKEGRDAWRHMQAEDIFVRGRIFRGAPSWRQRQCLFERNPTSITPFLLHFFSFLPLIGLPSWGNKSFWFSWCGVVSCWFRPVRYACRALASRRSSFSTVLVVSPLFASCPSPALGHTFGRHILFRARFAVARKSLLLLHPSDDLLLLISLTLFW